MNKKSQSLGFKLFFSAFHAAIILIVGLGALPLLADAGVVHGVERWITMTAGWAWLAFLAWLLVVSPWVSEHG